jgi:hypothetical protein
MLKRMTVYNFKWFLHAMLFIHTQRVIQKQAIKNRREEEDEDEDEEDEDEDEEDEEGTDIEEEEE